MFWIAAIALATSLLSAYAVLRFSERLGLIDVPNARSSHHEATPRGGGLGIVLAFCLSLALYAAVGSWGTDYRAFWGLITGLIIVGFIGFLDDLRGLPLAVRLAAHLLAASIAVVGIGSLHSIEFPVLGELSFGILAVPLSILWIVGMTNVYNFMDGIDGLAAGEGVLAGAFLAYIAGMVGNTLVSAVALFVAAASLGFLLFNFPPAKIFMGDVGSTTLGFAFSALAIMGSTGHASPIPFLVFPLLLGAFLFDGMFTILRRAVRWQKLHEAHRDHFYQYAVRLGYSHRQVSLFEYALELLLGGSAICYVLGSAATQLALLLLWLFFFAAISLWLAERSRLQYA